MSIYETGNSQVNNGELTQTEAHLYGSSRLGIFTLQRNVENPASGSGGNGIFERGGKFFELTNHLGNVLVTISDKKLGHDAGNGTIGYYLADVVSAQDYYPFGMMMAGRVYRSPGGGGYRYGFNGKENDNEVKGEGNQQDYGMRIYDPRLGRFLSVDPITNDYPELTPYQFASNTPIRATDLDGLEMNPRTINAAITIHDASLMVKVQNGDKEAARELSILLRVNQKIGFTQLATAATILTAGRSSTLLKTIFKDALIGGVIGASVNTGFSYAKGEEGYDLLKSVVSGFFSGSILGAFGKVKSLEELYTVGFTSASTGEFINQTFDNLFGDGDDSYDLEKIVVSGGIGGVANIISNKIVDYAKNLIDKKVAAKILISESSKYREFIKKAIKSESPRIGTQNLKKAVNQRIKEIQKLIEKQGDLEKQAVTQSIERAVDYLQNKTQNE